MTAENVQRGDAAFDKAAKDGAILAHGRHEKGRLERRLRDPRDGGGAERAAVAGSEDVYPVGEQAQSLLFGFLIHISPGRRRALYVNAERYGKEHARTKVRSKPSGCMLERE